MTTTEQPAAIDVEKLMGFNAGRGQAVAGAAVWRCPSEPAAAPRRRVLHRVSRCSPHERPYRQRTGKIPVPLPSPARRIAAGAEKGRYRR